MREMIRFYLSGAWTSKRDVIRKMQGSEKLDQTLDEIRCEFFDGYYSAPFEYGTPVQVFLDDVSPTTDSLDKPYNYRGMIVKQDKTVTNQNGIVRHILTLVEPTDVLRQVRMESLTFTSRESITVKEFNGSSWVDVTYTKDAYNLYTVIERILKITRYKTSVEDNSWTNRITIADTNLLQSVGYNADDSFKENTLYDALLKIGMYINRIPVLYLDNTTPTNFYLFFERKDGQDLSQLTYSTISANSKAIIKSNSAEQVADAVVSDATNMVSYNVAQGIAQDWYGFAVYDGVNQTIGAGSTEKPFLYLPQRIGEVVGVRSMLSTYDSGFGVFPTEFTTIPCVKRKEWEIRTDRDDIAYYDENEKKIYLGDNLASDVLLYNSSTSVTATRLYFNVKYYAVIDAKITKSKYENVVYETTFNQTDSFIDAGTYGSMLEDYIKANGNAEITLNIKQSDFTSLYKLGQQVIDDEDTYFITAIAWNTTGDGLDVIYQLNKDAVKRNDYVGASQKIREGGIDYDNTQIRYSTIRDNVTITFQTSAPSAVSNNYLLNKKSLLYGLFSSADKTTYRNELVQQAYLRARSTIYKVGTGFVTQNEYVQYAFASTRSGNSLLMNIQFDDIKIAGYKLTPSSPIIQSPVYYSNPFAEIDTLTIGFGVYKAITSSVASQPDGVSFDLSISERADIDYYAKTYPDLSESDFNTYYASSAIQISAYKYMKDAREIGNITYQLDWLGDACVINPELLNYCGLLQKDVAQPTLYVIVLDAGKKLAQNDIILTADIASISYVGSPDVTNRSNYLKYTTTSSLTASNQTVALVYQVSSGVYKPLVFANGRYFTSQSNFYIGY